VYLDLRGDEIEFEIFPKSVMVRIPVSIWEVIRRTGAANFDLVEKTDEELLEMVKKEVDERVVKYEQRKQENSPSSFLSVSIRSFTVKRTSRAKNKSSGE
ncbi:MAG: hypothetical protein ACR2N3_13805, partial [Pyrinomonadaceae bacterium]